MAQTGPRGVADRSDLLERERVANRAKHWVRAVTACNSRCLFCLDADTPRNIFLPEAEVQAELRRGIEELGADKVIISGGEASLHPAFPALIRYGRSIGYDRVQTVTNGYRFADAAFYRECMAAGLGEITFSLHGHTAELHDHLTQVEGAFVRLMKGMVRALRDPAGPIVNVDVVINKQNVAVLDKIVELCISVGVTEFDLLHVIPQANAFDNKDDLFYDVRDHLPVLHKVFRLNRHPRFVVWTNRFPVEFLEGLEELIQDPHKMLDEINGRRFMVRNYLDTGKRLECRQADRCVHCFIEPLCTTMDRVIARQRAAAFEVWTVPPGGDIPAELPFGCSRVGLSGISQGALPTDVPGLEVSVTDPAPLPEWAGPPLRLIAETAEALEAWVGAPLAPGVEVEVRLNRETADWMLQHREALSERLGQLRVHQPSHEHVSEAITADVRDPAELFGALGLPLRTSGLPACAAPHTVLVDEIHRLDPSLFEPDTGRLDVRGLARHHVREAYRSKSVRCRDCRVEARCEGLPINMVRDQGLRLARPLEGAWADEAERQLLARWPTPPPRVRDGAPPLPPAPSLPGFAEPGGPVEDPLAHVATRLKAAREARRREQATAAGED